MKAYLWCAVAMLLLQLVGLLASLKDGDKLSWSFVIADILGLSMGLWAAILLGMAYA